MIKKYWKLIAGVIAGIFGLLFIFGKKSNNKKASAAKKKIDTKSNLRSDVLKELCQMFDLDFIKFDEFTSVIDRLVNVRNSIAHGENSIKVSQENINAYMDSVNGAMEVFLNEVNLYLENESYLAKQVA